MSETKNQLSKCMKVCGEWFEFPISGQDWSNPVWTKKADPYSFTKDLLAHQDQEYSDDATTRVAILRYSSQYRFFAINEWTIFRDKTVELMQQCEPEEWEQIMRGLLGDDVVNPEHDSNARQIYLVKYAENLPLSIDK